MTHLLAVEPCSPLLIDSSAPVADLYACATERINAARRLMQSLAQTSSTVADGKDLNALCCAVSILLVDGCAVLEVAARQGGFDAGAAG